MSPAPPDAGAPPAGADIHPPSFVEGSWCGRGGFYEDQFNMSSRMYVAMRFSGGNGATYRFSGEMAYYEFCCDGRLRIASGILRGFRVAWFDGETLQGGPFTPGKYVASFSADERTLSGEWQYPNGDSGGTFTLTSTACR